MSDWLQESPLFRGVDAAVVEATLVQARRRMLSAGERLLRAGDANDDLFLVVSGSLGVHLASPGRLYVRLGPGDCAGELSVIDRSQVSADVIAAEPCEVLAIDRARVWALVESSAEVARNLLRILAGHVRHDNAEIAESDRLQLEMEQVAMIDATTGLRNRRWLDSAFDRQMSRTLRDGHPVALLMVDVDDFKRVNDRHGHQAGDAVLRRTGQWMVDALRPQDLVARYGGDEFAVLLPNADLGQAIAAAERLRTGIGGLRDPSGPDALPPVTVSIGAAATRDAVPFGDLLARADEALYRAKAAGRDRVGG